MKTKLSILYALPVLFILNSCSPNYYQLYKANSLTDTKVQGGAFQYEDKNCIVTYDLWVESGNAGFKFYNKTDEDIYLDLGESFFIKNGVANDYFGNRTTTESNGETIGTSNKASWRVNSLNSSIGQFLSVGSISSVGKSSTKSHSISYTESKLIIIPPKTAKIITEFSINNNIIRECDFLRYPSKKQVRPLTFTSANSPLTFSNRISYKVGNGNTIKFENAFYISEVANYPSTEFFEMRKDKDCKGKSKSVRSQKFASPLNFYITYQKVQDGSKF